VRDECSPEELVESWTLLGDGAVALLEQRDVGVGLVGEDRLEVPPTCICQKQTTPRFLSTSMRALG
jgi:hypothetical protein